MSRPKQYDGQRVTTALRLPADLHAAVKEAAAERDVSANWLMERAITEFMANLIPAADLRMTRPRP